jgi:superfamily II DNA or RNA helicase
MINKYTITKKGCVLNKDDFSDNDINWIKSDLTVRPSSSYIAKNESFKVYLESPTQICLPKFYALEKFSIPCIIDNNYGKDINTSFILELRDEQKKIIKPILDAYQTRGGGILSLPCGFGKTIMALYFIVLLQKKTLIIVHRQFLITHWQDKIKEYLKNVRVKIIKDNNILLDDCDIVICMLQTLSLREFPKGYFDSIGHIVIDEVHRVSTTTFSNIFFKINSNYMLGLSATPERKDNMTKVIKWHIGDIINVNCVKHQINIDVNRYVLNMNKEDILENNVGNLSDKISKLLNYDLRNQIILSIIINELNNCTDRHFLVLSDRVDHLKKLKKLFNINGVNSVGLFIGEMSMSDLEITKKNKIILGTYSMSNEGLDIPTLNCLVLASPKIEVFQTIGRISRLQKNNKYVKPLIIDFIDILPVFIKEADKRLLLYNKNKYNVIDYVYNKNTKKFTQNLSKNRDYDIYLLDEKIIQNKHIVNNNSIVDELFKNFNNF